MRVTITYDYEISPETLEEAYGTFDPKEVAEIDQRGLQDDPSPMFDDMSCTPFTVRVEHVED